MAITITPDSFWTRYREEIRRTANVEAYGASKSWTRVTIEAAEQVCRSFGLDVSREYLRLDCAGYEYRGGSDADDWDLRVAFEHEAGINAGKDWRDELCKLCHVVADLRVIVGYCVLRRGDTVPAQLNERIVRMGYRMTHVPHANWLLIFGSGTDTWCRNPWQAFTFDGRLTALVDEEPLSPAGWCPPLE